MIEVVNEPEGRHSNLNTEYYPTAYSKIRDVEKSLGTKANDYIHIQFMDKAYTGEDPNQKLGRQYFVAYDHHRYINFDDTVSPTQEAYLQNSCHHNVASDGNLPVVVGEWSIAVKGPAEEEQEFKIGFGNNNAFYKKFWATQVVTYEKQEGWIFWSWKTQRGNDFRWSYKDAVEAGIIPKDPNDAYSLSVC
jgi:aryl-phospho-beta-D-glucosidase BglC (GH1 family)